MRTLAYLTNQYPAAVEPYVVEEIRELRSRGVNVIPCSVRLAEVALDEELTSFAAETSSLEPIRHWVLAKAAWRCVRNFRLLSGLVERIILGGRESLPRRVRALLHTWLGVYYALLLEGKDVGHIHVHHGYFASWIALVAARMLGISFSMTLHGSDLLLHSTFLDVKLENCRFCFTVSQFNRQYILKHFPDIKADKIIVQPLGVDLPSSPEVLPEPNLTATPPVVLAVGRLHAVKNYPFLIIACHWLKQSGRQFLCLIAGDGPERPSLERLIRDLGLQAEVRLLGHCSRRRLGNFYRLSDVVVLTSHSEGIPLVLMEAMAHGKPVLAPAITGIPELVSDGKTGFLYRPGSMEDFLANLEMIFTSRSALAPVGRAARRYVLEHFHRQKNLANFGDVFLAQIAAQERPPYEGLVLQQI